MASKAVLFMLKLIKNFIFKTCHFVLVQTNIICQQVDWWQKIKIKNIIFFSINLNFNQEKYVLNCIQIQTNKILINSIFLFTGKWNCDILHTGVPNNCDAYINGFFLSYQRKKKKLETTTKSTIYTWVNVTLFFVIFNVYFCMFTSWNDWVSRKILRIWFYWNIFVQFIRAFVTFCQFILLKIKIFSPWQKCVVVAVNLLDIMT